MKSKELVEKCNKQSHCKECVYGEVCFAYQMQFNCFPFDAKMKCNVQRGAYSDIEIYIPEYI